MSVIARDPRRYHPPGRRHRLTRPALAAALALVAVAAPSAGAGTPVLAAPPTGTTPASVTPGSLGLTQVPGLDGSPTMVRLITGQQVQLSRDRDGHYTITQDPASMMPGPDGQPPAELVVHGETDPGATDSTMTATPTYAQQLVDSGVIDPHLFDVTYLAQHDYTTGTVPVVVHYAAPGGATAVAKAAAALAGASYVKDSATATQATVNVDLAKAGTFWSAVTRTPDADPNTPTGKVWYHNPNAPQVLRDGITALTLAGSPTTAATNTPAAQPGLTQPTYQLSIRLHAFTDPNRWAYGFQAMIYQSSYLFGRTGLVAGHFQGPTSIVCNQTDTCDTWTITYSNVPAGSYQLNLNAIVTRDFHSTELHVYRPQIDLYANRTIDLQADDATYASLQTPQPSEPADVNQYSVNYQIPDGRTWADAGVGIGDYQPGYWMRDNDPITAGTFSLQLDQIAKQPPITMSVAEPSRPGITLTPTYPYWRTYYPRPTGPGTPGGQGTVYDFPNGTHSYPIVDVGAGTDADFAGKDLTGKLALMWLDDGAHSPCSVSKDQLNRAIQAHAVGVLFDITRRDGLVGNTGGCYPEPRYDREDDPAPSIPWVTIHADQARALENLLQTKPVSISVTGHSVPDYLYIASTNYERAIPSVVRTLTAKDLVAETTTIRPLQADEDMFPNIIMNGVQATTIFTSTANYREFIAKSPYRTTVYTATAAPDTELIDQAKSETPAEDEYEYLQTRYEMPVKPGATTVNYGQAPFTIGAATVPPNAGILGYTVVCAACRQGNDFVPYVLVGSGAAPDGWVSTGLLGGQLTANGVAIPRDTYGYTLPAESTKYDFTAHAAEADYHWTFTSAAPKADATPYAKACVNGLLTGSTDPCAPVPLVFVRYVAPVDGFNQAPSGTQATLTVTAYHEGDQAPAITGLAQEVSFDHGTTWVPAKVSRTGTDGTYEATFTVPPLGQTDGYVSLRTTAHDAAGNSTTQTYYDSYALK